MIENRLAEIEKYVSNEMAEAERLAFERAMAIDADLRADVKIFRTLRDAVLEQETIDENNAELRRSLQSLGADFFLTNINSENVASSFTAPVKKIKYPKMLAAAAVVIGIIMLTAIWVIKGDKNQSELAKSEKTDTANKAQQDKNIQASEKPIGGKKQGTEKNKEPDMELLYAQYFKSDAIPSEPKTELALGYKLYAAGDIANARTFFEAAKQDDYARSDDTNIKQKMFYIDYYIAQCFMAEQKPGEAISNLKSALNKSPGDSLTAKTQWYLALAYMKINDKKSAADLLQQLNNKTTPIQYRKNAKNLLKELAN